MDQHTTNQDPGFQARCLLRRACWATLATQHDGQPAAALVTQATAPDGAVLMLLSSMSEHSRHLSAEPRCALMATGAPENLNWQTAPRISLSGRATRLEDQASRRYWIARHPYARLYADFTDFAIWRLVPESGLFVAGFGQITRLSAADLTPQAAAVAALAEAQPRILARWRAEHAADLDRLAHAAGHPDRWTLIGVDPDGFDLAQDDRSLRLAFDAPVADEASLRPALIRLLNAERNGHFTG
jgi:putative heme iron utilization protein